MKIKNVIIDSDIGDDIDDAYALALALKCPEIKIEAILTNNRYTKERAMILKKLVKLAKKNIPVIKGLDGGKGRLSNQKLFIKNFKSSGLKSLNRPLTFVKNIIRKSKITLISLGALTNVEYLLENLNNKEKSNLNLLIMGGSLNKDYHGKNQSAAEWNIYSDIKAAQNVFSNNVPITLVPLDSTWNLELTNNNIRKINNSKDPLNNALYELYKYWKRSHTHRNPILYDSFTVSLLIKKSFAKFEKMMVKVNDKGYTVVDPNGNPTNVAIESRKKDVIDFFISRLL